MNTVHIYGLCDPITGQLRYIGKARHIAKRLGQHYRERRRRTPLYDWIKTLPAAPEAFSIEAVPADSWQESEQFWIAYFRFVGCRLLNLAKGGDEPAPTKEQRQGAARSATRARMNGTDLQRKLWEIRRRKKDVEATLVRYGKPIDLYLFRFRCHLRAAERPDLFGEWASP